MKLFNKTPDTIDQEIERIYETMKDTDPTSEAYKELTARLDDLQKIKKNKKQHVSPDVKASIAANLLGIGLVLKHEELKVISSKAFGLIRRVK